MEGFSLNIDEITQYLKITPPFLMIDYVNEIIPHVGELYFFANIYGIDISPSSSTTPSSLKVFANDRI